MKICVVSTPIFKFGPQGAYGYSGLEHLAWQQAAGLAARGHDVSLIAPDNSVCPDVTVIPVGPEQQIDEMGAYSKYWPHLLDSVDCVIDHSWNKWSFILKQEGKLKCPILGWLHAPVNTMYSSLPPVEKPCMVCISKDQGSHFEALHNRECRVCYNGVDELLYSPLNIKRTDRFLFLARFSSVKSPDAAIEACLKAGVGLDLVGDTQITGEPELVYRCQQMALQQSPNWNREKDGQQIRIIGPAKRGECVWWMSQATAMVHLNQRFREPFGLAPVEAQLTGCPVIVWDNGAMRETIQDGRTGFLVKSMEQAVNVVSAASCDYPDGHMWDRDYVRQWAMQFSVNKMIDRVEELIDESVSKGGW